MRTDGIRDNRIVMKAGWNLDGPGHKSTVRKWLILPRDLPIEAFYTNIEDGGLQLPNLRYGLPIANIAWLKKMGDKADPLIRKQVWRRDFKLLKDGDSTTF